MRATLWRNEEVIDLGSLAGPYTEAHALNSRGEVVGRATVESEEMSPPFFETHAFLWKEGRMYDLNDLAPQRSGWVLEVATGINDRGEIIGWGIPPGAQSSHSHAFVMTPMKETDAAV